MTSQSTKGAAVPSTRDGSRPARPILIGIIAFAAAFWLLRETYSIVMPLTYALLLGLGVWPVVAAIRQKMPTGLQWLGATAGLLIVLAILAVFLIALGLAVRQIFELGTDLGPRLQELSSAWPLPDIFSDGPGTGIESIAADGPLVSGALTALGITAQTAGTIVLILFLMLLMLTEAQNWHSKIRTLVSRGGDQRWLDIAQSVGEKFRSYLAVRLMVGILSAALYVGWLAIFGFDYLFLWGILTVLLNFIPTIGSIISGMLPVAYAVVTRDPASAAIVATGLLVIEQVMGNFVDPKIVGRRLSVSPLVVLVSLMFWSIVWGIPGAFIAVPTTVLITMVLAHFDRLKPAALLLTDCTSMDELERYSTPG